MRLAPSSLRGVPRALLSDGPPVGHACRRLHDRSPPLCHHLLLGSAKIRRGRQNEAIPILAPDHYVTYLRPRG
ncbi:MAG: hypothetical protein ABSF69_13495, partial [Polyangiaceae bacterium]